MEAAQTAAKEAADAVDDLVHHLYTADPSTVEEAVMANDSAAEPTIEELLQSVQQSLEVPFFLIASTLVLGFVIFLVVFLRRRQASKTVVAAPAAEVVVAAPAAEEVVVACPEAVIPEVVPACPEVVPAAEEIVVACPEAVIPEVVPVCPEMAPEEAAPVCPEVTPLVDVTEPVVEPVVEALIDLAPEPVVEPVVEAH